MSKVVCETDKFLCESTELTRSEAKKVLRAGLVSCDGQIVKNSGFKVEPDSCVEVEGRRVEPVGFRYIMLHKPLDCICSTVGDDMYPSVLELIDVDKHDRLRIAGRLDADTTGLLLITDDGQWSHKITSPRKECGKRYRVELADPLEESAIEQFSAGVKLDGERKLTLPAQLDLLSPYEALLTIHEGKYHQVKRMFAALGNRVTALHREQIGHIELDEFLEPGEWRYLTSEEIESI